MKAVLVVFFASFTALAVAADNAVAPGNKDNEAVPAKRVKSVTWDLQNQKLVWIVEDGTAKNGNFTPSSEERYEITPKDHAMAFQGEHRAFTSDEGTWLQHLLDILTMYCAESTVWWLDGQGEPQQGEPSSKDGGPTANPHATPPDHPDNAPNHDTAPKRIKISYPDPQPAPGAVQLVARNMIY